jgi:2-aminoethylphosphonate-pyruvate transaminase
VILLNPGPVNLSERVRAALLRPDLCHREPEFSLLQSSIREGLLAVYELDPAEWCAVLLTGSGTAAMEAMLSSLVPSGATLLVVENGVYGERLSSIARIHGITCVSIQHHWTDAIDLDRVAACLDSIAGISHLAVVHHETTTGRLNDLEALAGLCSARGVRLLVDAVSSYGAERLDFEQWNVDAAAGTANKCLHGVPGVSFVIVRRPALARDSLPRRSLYLDLAGYSKAQDRGTTPFTQSVQVFYAFAEALAEFHETGGRASRHRRYRALAELVRNDFSGSGVQPLIPAEQSSVVLRAYRLPEDLSYEHLHHALKERGFVIYAGQGELAWQIFRVSTMGELTAEDLHRFTAAVGECAKGASQRSG